MELNNATTILTNLAWFLGTGIAVVLPFALMGWSAKRYAYKPMIEHDDEEDDLRVGVRIDTKDSPRHMVIYGNRLTGKKQNKDGIGCGPVIWEHRIEANTFKPRPTVTMGTEGA